MHREGTTAKVAAKCSLSHFVEIPAHVNKLDDAYLPRLSAARDWEDHWQDRSAYRRRSTLHRSADDGVSFHLPQLNPKSLGVEDTEAVKRSERNSMAQRTEYLECNAGRLGDYLIAPDAAVAVVVPIDFTGTDWAISMETPEGEGRGAADDDHTKSGAFGGAVAVVVPVDPVVWAATAAEEVGDVGVAVAVTVVGVAEAVGEAVGETAELIVTAEAVGDVGVGVAVAVTVAAHDGTAAEAGHP